MSVCFTYSQLQFSLTAWYREDKDTNKFYRDPGIILGILYKVCITATAVGLPYLKLKKGWRTCTKLSAKNRAAHPRPTTFKMTRRQRPESSPTFQCLRLPHRNEGKRWLTREKANKEVTSGHPYWQLSLYRTLTSFPSTLLCLLRPVESSEAHCLPPLHIAGGADVRWLVSKWAAAKMPSLCIYQTVWWKYPLKMLSSYFCTHQTTF